METTPKEDTLNFLERGTFKQKLIRNYENYAWIVNYESGWVPPSLEYITQIGGLEIRIWASSEDSIEFFVKILNVENVENGEKQYCLDTFSFKSEKFGEATVKIRKACFKRLYGELLEKMVEE